MAGLIQKVVGHQEQVEWLTSRVIKDSLPSTLIFQGPQGVGKKLIARALLQAFNCEKEQTACGQCSVCVRSLEDKNELIYLLQPESKKIISVDQVREIHKYLSLQSLHKARFVLVDPAEKLSHGAANALLKIFEEAPRKTYFIIITENIFGLLPTIRSRAHQLAFGKLSAGELKKLSTLDEDILQWADGRVELAESLQEAETVDYLNQSLRLLYDLFCQSPQDWKKRAPWFFSNDHWRNFSFMIWSQAFEKKLYRQNSDLDWLPDSPQVLTSSFEMLEKLRSDIARNVDKQLALENFYYSVRESM